MDADIIRMAREAGLVREWMELCKKDEEALGRFANLVRADEREACATRLEAIGCDHCAANIRARHHQPPAAVADRLAALREAAIRVLAEHDSGFHGLPLTEALEALRAALAEPEPANYKELLNKSEARLHEVAVHCERVERRLREVNTVAMKLTSDLCCMYVDDDDRLSRDRVMERVMQWRNEWDKAMFEEVTK